MGRTVCRVVLVNAHAPSCRDLSTLVRVLNRIEDPSARKIVIMSKRERGMITDAETSELIRLCDVVHA